MLRRGQGVMIWVRVAVFAVMLILLFSIGNMVYNAILQPDDDSAVALSGRLGFLVNGGLSTNPADRPRGYAQTVFLHKGAEDEGLVVFDSPGQRINYEYGNTEIGPIDNPCDGACLCQLTDKGPDDCEDLNVGEANIVRALPLSDRALYQVSGEQDQAQLYPTLPPSHRKYSDAIITAQELKESEGTLYLEYSPSGTVLLVTPLTTEFQESTDYRHKALDVCQQSGDADCRGQPKRGADKTGEYICVPTATGCETQEAETCEHGLINRACKCGEQVRSYGYCVEQPGGTEQAWYPIETYCETGTRQRCQDYATDGLNMTNKHACVLDLCQASSSFCVPDTGANECKQVAYASRVVAEVARNMISQGPGYRYEILDLPQAHYPIIGLGKPSKGQLLYCLASMDTCEGYWAALRQDDPDTSGWEYHGSIAFREGGAYICSLDSAVHIPGATPGGISTASQRVTFSQLPSKGGELDLELAVDKGCGYVGEDVLLLGTDRRILAQDADEAYAGFGQRNVYGLYTMIDEPIVVQVRVPEEGPSVVQVTPYDDRSSPLWLAMGCHESVCPPSP